MWFVMMATEEAETGGVIRRWLPATLQFLKVERAVSVRVKQLSRIPATNVCPLVEDSVKPALQRAMPVMEMQLILEKAKWSGRVNPMLKGTTNSLDRRAYRSRDVIQLLATTMVLQLDMKQEAALALATRGGRDRVALTKQSVQLELIAVTPQNQFRDKHFVKSSATLTAVQRGKCTATVSLMELEMVTKSVLLPHQGEEVGEVVWFLISQR